MVAKRRWVPDDYQHGYFTRSNAKRLRLEEAEWAQRIRSPFENVLSLMSNECQTQLLWPRPKKQIVRPEMDAFDFQSIEMARTENIIRLYGCTKQGNSVCCYVDKPPSLLAINQKLNGSNWIRLPPGMYRTHSGLSETRCQIEIDVDFDKILVLRGDWMEKEAPFRIMSIEIEVVKIEMAPSIGVPDAQNGTILQIGNMVVQNGANEPFVRNIFTLNACASVDGVQVICCDNEKEMLEKWIDFVLKIDPDIITGFCIFIFDIPFLVERAEILEVKNIALLGRLRTGSIFNPLVYPAQVPYKTRCIQFEGVTLMDTFHYVRGRYKTTQYPRDKHGYTFIQEGDIKSYKLEDVSELVLNEGEQFEKIGYDEIKKYVDKKNGHRLALFTAQKTYIPLRIVRKLKCVSAYLRQARNRGSTFTLNKVIADEIGANRNFNQNFNQNNRQNNYRRVACVMYET